jgi:hypothetical protein
VKKKSAEADVSLSGIFTLSCHVVHLTRLISCSLNYSTTYQDKVNKPLSPTSEMWDRVVYLP